jgi:cyclophilin family peptidyl-prolyl cis-trans isomerase
MCGRVMQGKEVVDKIKAVPTGSQGMYENEPTTPVVITQASILSNQAKGLERGGGAGT